MRFAFLATTNVPDRLLLRKASAYYGSIFHLDPYNDEGELSQYIENVPYSDFIVLPKRDMISDIRGFTIKVPVNNIMLLLTESYIQNGRICEPCQYVSMPGSCWLAPIRLIRNG